MVELTQDLLRAEIRYDPSTGLMTWINARGRCAAGSPAGYAADRGYRGIRIFGRCYYAHRVAFLHMTGRLPLAVDHINGIRDDNRWANLREVTNAENSKNVAKPITNKSGVIGVFWNSGKGKWTARIKVNKVGHHLGHFDQIAKAVKAREDAERTYGFHKNHGRLSTIHGAPA